MAKKVQFPFKARMYSWHMCRSFLGPRCLPSQGLRADGIFEDGDVDYERVDGGEVDVLAVIERVAFCRIERPLPPRMIKRSRKVRSYRYEALPTRDVFTSGHGFREDIPKDVLLDTNQPRWVEIPEDIRRKLYAKEREARFKALTK